MGGHLNICGFISKSDEIKHIIVDSNLDFLCLSETWLNKNSPSAALHIPGYNAFSKDRKVGKGGGLLLYIKDHISCKEVQCSVNNDLEHICLNISLEPQMSFSHIGVYRPPFAKAIFFDKLETVLRECSSGQEILGMGDFNVNCEDKGTSKALQRV
jgi:exonuclease III